MRPNILLIVLDAARRDALEPYGAPPGSTPTIAQLAGRGAALAQMYAAASWTTPSHGSIFTGLMPRAAGLARVASPGSARAALARHRDRCLAEVLRRAGYASSALSANVWVSELSGFDAGFERFVSIDSGRHARIDGGRRDRLWWLAEAAHARVDDGAAQAERVLERWIAESPRRPFFWFVNLVECHSPYLPPRPYHDASLVERLRAAEDARRYYRLDAIWRASVGGLEMPRATLGRMRRLYRASIRYMDAWLGRLLERLDSQHMLDDTLVIVTSDHGESFGEHGLLAHGLSLGNQLIHVPFVFAGPAPDTTGFASLAALPRVIAESAGLADHPWHDGPPPGVGVAQLDAPADPDDPRLIATVESWGLGDDTLERLTAPLACAVAGDLKLVRRAARDDIYDLRADPLEAEPLDPGELVAERGGEIATLRDALEHPAMSSVAPASNASAEATAAELRELEERMRVLGYM